MRPSARQICYAKTAAGTVFGREGDARRVAQRMTAAKGEVIVAYRCPECRRWHVGRKNKRHGESA